MQRREKFIPKNTGLEEKKTPRNETVGGAFVKRTKNDNYASGRVFGRFVKRVRFSSHCPRFLSKSMRSKRLRTVRFVELAAALLKLLC